MASKNKKGAGCNEQYTMYQFETKKFNIMEFEAEWKDLIGDPELAGSWFIWGRSGGGKTRFAARLAKYLLQFGSVAYNSLEQGCSHSLRIAFKAEGLLGKNRIVLWRKSVANMIEDLSKRKSPSIIIIDSFQYTKLSYDDYIEFKQQFPNKLLIFISHAEGREPKGSHASSVRYDADVKLYVEGYRVFAQSRYGGEKPLDIWHEKAVKYWGDVKEIDNEQTSKEEHENEE